MERVLLDAAAAAEPREACGVLSQDRAWELPNRASARDETFHLHAEDLAAAASAAGGWSRITAIWHSHPLGYGHRPSEEDLAHHPAGKVMVIVASGRIHCYGEA